MSSEEIEPSPDESALIGESLRRAERLLATDASFRRSVADDELLSRLEGVESSVELLAKAAELYGDRPALAFRPDGAAAFTTLTFGETWAVIERLATSWQRDRLVGEGDFVALVAYGGPEFLQVEVATVYVGATAVPLQTNLPPGALLHALKETRARVIVCDRTELPTIVRVLAELPNVATVILLGEGPVPSRVVRAAPGRDVNVTTLAAVLARGTGAPARITAPRAGQNPLRTLVYTSGSTGTPKGARFLESAYRQKWLPGRARAYPFLPGFPLPLPVSFVFSPLGHQMGNELLAASLMRGGLTYLATSGDIAHLFADFRAARPAFIGFVPRVANQIYEDFTSEVGRRVAWSEDPERNQRARVEVMAEMRQSYLGDRLLCATSASAPIAPEVIAFLRACFRVPVYNLMGMTELGGYLFDGRIRRDNVLGFRLVDVPELGFSARDEPYPRGELELSTRRQVAGYFASEEATRATFTEDGYLRTGDIFEQREGETLRFLARKTRVLKLAQGKFVNLGELESAFVTHGKLVKQAFLYANGDRTYPLAVLVPNLSELRARHGLGEGDPEPAFLRRCLQEDLARVAQELTLKPWEIPRAFLVELAPFSRENGLMAANNKLSPARLKERYGAALDALYEELDEGRRVREKALLDLPPDAPLAVKLEHALLATLSFAPEGSSWLERTFGELGGDSISAVALSALLARQWQVRLPVALLLGRTATLGDILQQLETQRSAGLASARTPDSERLRADDFALEHWLAPVELAGAAAPSAALSEEAPRVVLLTGANGFLGRFVLLELAARPEVARVVCIVRARNDSGARERLRSTFATDPDLAARFAELYEQGRITVLAGDLLRPGLGLSDASLGAVTEEADAIVHAGALVNHALGYDDLFEPNVLGTLEVARLALRGRRKRVCFVSSVGIAEGRGDAHSVREDETARMLWPERERHERAPGYGYASTKWAGELLLTDLGARFGVTIDLVRASNVMAHPRYRGQLNADDFLCRLACGLADSGVAPASFYAPGVDGAAFDGVPVDFAARAIAALCLRGGAAGTHIHHLAAPPSPTGFTLDELVPVLASRGFELTRIADHARWYEAFSARLSALEGERRRRSPLLIAARWQRPLRRGARLDSSGLAATLARLMPPELARFPVLGPSFLEKCVDDLRQLGVLT